MISASGCLTCMATSSQIAMPHQWLEGNLPVSAKCAVCDKTCGSVLRLQDWKCLWCKAMVGTTSKCLRFCQLCYLPLFLLFHFITVLLD